MAVSTTFKDYGRQPVFALNRVQELRADICLKCTVLKPRYRNERYATPVT